MSQSGRIEAIYLRPTSEAPAQEAPTARLVAGRGLEDDRYFFPEGAAPGEALTLIAAESLEGLRADTGIELDGAQSRRQIHTRGVDLNALVGHEFSLGGVPAWVSSCASHAPTCSRSPRRASCGAWCTAAACGPTC